MVKEKLTKTQVIKLAKDAPTTGIAEVRLKNPKRTGTITVRDYLDDKGELRPFVDQHGQERIIRFNKKMILDLTQLKDQLTYEQVRLHPIFVKGANPVLDLINHEVEDNNFVLQKDLESEANAIVKELAGKALKDFARVMLITFAEGSSDMSIKRKLYDKVEADPKSVINEWNDPSKDIKALIKNGIEKGIFTKIGGVYKFRDQVMGTSYELAIEWMHENDELIPSIRKELK